MTYDLDDAALWKMRRVRAWLIWTILKPGINLDDGKTNMSLTCESEVERGCLKMRVIGTFKSREETFRVMDMLKTEAAANDCKLALLNLIAAQGRTTDIDKFYLGEYAASVFRGSLKVAVVFPAESITKFGENVAVNRGAKLAVLATEEEAMTWLTQA